MARDNFSQDVVQRLAKRAGYLCSICSKITVGPSSESTLSVNITGIAAHISAASSGPGARRYDNSLTSAERSSIDNGIWLCNTHADYIDGDESKYSIQALKVIKKNHENKIEFSQSGINTSKGIITKIELSNFGEVKQPLTLELSNNNIIKGGNGVGKTLILELIASLTNSKVLKRWVNDGRSKVNSFYTIEYFKEESEKFTISIDKDNTFVYEYNDAILPFLAPSMKIIFLKQSYWKFVNSLTNKIRNQYSNIDLLAKYFKLKKKEFISVVGSIMRNKKFFCNDISIDLEEEQLLVSMFGNHSFYFNQLSEGEQIRVLLELTLKIASYYSKFNSTILLIDNAALLSLDKTGLNNLFKVIQNEKFQFQFIITTLDNDDYDYLDFKIHHLVTINGKTAVSI